MKAIELTKVMGEQFIAVGRAKDKNISYSGRASQFKGFLENCEVVEVIAAKRESSATIIYVR